MQKTHILAVLAGMVLLAPMTSQACAFHFGDPETHADRVHGWLQSMPNVMQRAPAPPAFKLDFPNSTTSAPGSVSELTVDYAWRALARDVRLEAFASNEVELEANQFSLSKATGSVQILYSLVSNEDGFIDLVISGIINGREVSQRERFWVRPADAGIAANHPASQR